MGPVRLRLLLFLLLLGCVPALAQHEHGPPAQSSAPGAAASTPKPDPRPWFLRGRHFREFGHQMAGMCLILAGGLLLLEKPISRRWPGMRYVWPCCLLFPGLYLLVLSDTEIWPFGDENLFKLLVTDVQVLQHKLFSLILLALGTIELERVRGRLTSTWSAFAFPVLALGGAVMLLFHPHGMEGHGPEHMAVMEHIHAQHTRFAIVGMLIAGTKAFAEIPWGRRLFARAWPSFMMLLGALLLIYRE